MPIPSKRALCLPVSACIFFFFAGRLFIPHIGIQTDEALFVGGIYQTQFAFYKIHLFHRSIPLMLSSYIGTLKSLIYAVVFRIFTPTAASTRIPVLLLGIATIWLFYLLLRRIAGPAAAVAGSLLLATDSMFLLTTVFDWGPVVLQHLLMVGAMLLLYRYYETHRLLVMGAGFFLLGLAMWDKAVFIWALSGLLAAAVVTFPRVLLRLASRTAIAVAALGFVLGALPLIKFNAGHRLETFRSNVHYSPAKLGEKLRLLVGTLQGAYLHGYLVREDGDDAPPMPPKSAFARGSERLSDAFGHPRRNLLLAATIGALLLLPLLARAGARSPRIALFAVTFLVVAWLEMALNPETGGSVHHAVLLWPLPHLMVAAAFGEAAQKFGRLGLAALIVMLALVLPSNLLVTNEYYRMMMRNGAGLTWTDAIFPMSDFLGSVSATQIMPIDWGFFDSLRLLHRGKLPLRNGSDPLSKPTLDSNDQEIVRQWLLTPGTVFVGHTEKCEMFKGVNAHLDAVADRCGLQKESMGIFRDHHGRPIFEVFRYNDR